jgi:hypothetical protein
MPEKKGDFPLEPNPNSKTPFADTYDILKARQEERRKKGEEEPEIKGDPTPKLNVNWEAVDDMIRRAKQHNPKIKKSEGGDE